MRWDMNLLLWYILKLHPLVLLFIYLLRMLVFDYGFYFLFVLLM